MLVSDWSITHIIKMNMLNMHVVALWCLLLVPDRETNITSEYIYVCS